MQPPHPEPVIRSRPVAAVTGARRGIGLGIATALAAAGFDLVLLDRSWDEGAGEDLEPLRATGARIRLLPFDLAAIERREAVVDEMIAAFGVPHCLVNNAGVQVAVRGDLLDVHPESFDRVMDVNLRGTFFLTQAVARRMLEPVPVQAVAAGPGGTGPAGAEPAGVGPAGMGPAGAEPAGVGPADAAAADRQPDARHRCIVVVSSVNATQPAPDRAEYCLSKSGLAMMTQLFALRLAAAGICVYEIRPGIIRTAMTAPAASKYDALIASGVTPIARWGTPEDVGRTVATLAQGRMPFSTGQAFSVDGGLHIHRL